MQVVRRIVRFVLIGGVVGGIVTVAWMLAWALSATQSEFEVAWIFVFLIYLFIGAFIGVIVGALPALITGLAYEWFPSLRRALPIALVGAAVSAIEGAFLPGLTFVARSSPSFQDRLEFAGVLALAGAVAAVVCHVSMPKSDDT